MAEPEPYSTPRGVENAIKYAAKRATAADPSLDVNERIRLEYFNRFLSRVFSEAEDSDWVLKGGTGMLARVPSTRATRDIDLYRRGFTLTQALDDLIRLAEIDLCDHFRFQYVSRTESTGNDPQPYTEGYQVRFEILIGLSTKGSLKVDLAVGTGITGEVTTTDPANALDLPRLVSHQYRLFPVVEAPHRPHALWRCRWQGVVARDAVLGLRRVVRAPARPRIVVATYLSPAGSCSQIWSHSWPATTSSITSASLLSRPAPREATTP